MRKLLHPILFAAALLACAQLRAVEVDGITATVGETSILRSEVYDLMRQRGERDASRYEAFRDELIERTLILKAAEASKLTMQDWVIRDQMRATIEKNFEGDRNKLVQQLARERLSMSDWERHVKEDLIVNAMRWNAVYKHVRVSPAEMQAEYKAHPERYRSGGLTTVSVILLKPEDAEKREDVTKAIAETSFADAARTFSADTHAADGGVWKDIVPAEVFKSALCDEIAKMPVGSISDWIDIDGWSFLLRKDGESPMVNQSFAEAYDAIDLHVREANAKRLHDAWIARLKAESHIRLY